MTHRLARAALLLIAPLLLFGCVLTPGKFVSTLTVNADRSFTFSYKGEVIAVETNNAMKLDSNDDTATDKPKADEAPSEETETKNRAIAAALAKEAGYRSVVYQGKGKFLIDYAVSGTLDHAFVFPFNSDAEVVIPFIAIELRADKLVRVRAPGFANAVSGSGTAPGMGAMGGDAAKALDGVFTLDTDAEIVSQNNEDGAKAAGRRKSISWRATPLTKDAPSAVLRMAR